MVSDVQKRAAMFGLSRLNFQPLHYFLISRFRNNLRIDKAVYETLRHLNQLRSSVKCRRLDRYFSKKKISLLFCRKTSITGVFKTHSEARGTCLSCV